MTVKPCLLFCSILVLMAVLIGSAALAVGQTESVLYSFTDGTQGATPNGNLVADGAGNLYGTTLGGGEFFGGNVYEMVPPVPPSTQWTQTVIYTFTAGSDGGNPSAGVIFDAAGNLYGTTSSGGTSDYGTVFRLSPPSTSGGQWTESTLYSFLEGSSDGADPEAGVVFDKAGNLYGTTFEGGITNTTSCTKGCGVVFKLTPPASGGEWTESVIEYFNYGNGGYPRGTLILDPSGNFYGTTLYGGQYGGGVIFRLTPPSKPGHAWGYRVLYAFGATTTDSSEPWAGLTLRKGVLYGAASLGGPYRGGTVFQLVGPTKSGEPWTENILLNFDGNDGYFPNGNVIFDKSGNLYGTTMFGGLLGNCDPEILGCGVVFELSPPKLAGGSWTDTILHSFPTTQDDGMRAVGGLLIGNNGALFGVTQSGITATDGTVFEIVK